MVNKVIAQSLFVMFCGKHDVSDAMFSINGSHSPKHACQRHGFDLRHENMEIGTVSNVSLERKINNKIVELF